MKRKWVALLVTGVFVSGLMAGCATASASRSASAASSRATAGSAVEAAADENSTAHTASVSTVANAEDYGKEDARDSGSVDEDDGETTISVSGTGTVTVAPDIAQISVGVQTADESTKAAQAANTQAVNAVIEALKKAGIEEKNIATSGLDIYANYNYSDNGNGNLTGYTVTTTLSVSNLKVGDVGKLIDVATDAGANQVYGINYSYSDSMTAYDQALEAALDRAEEKAQKIADKEGKTLGAIKKVEENSNSYDTPVDSSSSSKQAAAEDNSMQVLAGQTDVSATVTVTYYFE